MEGDSESWLRIRVSLVLLRRGDCLDYIDDVAWNGWLDSGSRDATITMDIWLSAITLMFI